MATLKKKKSKKLYTKFFRSNSQYQRCMLWNTKRINPSFHAVVISLNDGLLKPEHQKLIQKEYQRVVAYNSRLKKRQMGQFCIYKVNAASYPYSKKPIGVRMGRGKANVYGIATPIYKGQDLMVFRRGTNTGLVSRLVNQLNYKLPVELRMIKRS